MKANTISRRTLIKTGLALLALTGCGPRRTRDAITVTENPPPPTSPSTSAAADKELPATEAPSADGVVQLYLEAWQQGAFEKMYTLLSPESQRRIPFPAFFTTYQNAFNQTTATDIQTQIRSLLVEEAQATATYQSRWVTSLFDVIEADHTMSLRYVQGRWLVVWEPTLVLPQLGHGLTLALLEERPNRGLIYDLADLALASQKQLVTIGVVPGLVEDEGRLINQMKAIAGLEADKIQAKMRSARPDWFVPLVDIDFEESIQYHETLSALAGVQRRPHPVRTYTHRDMAAHIMGTMGAIPSSQTESYKIEGYRGDELIGLSGIEGWGEHFLAGRRGGKLVTLSTENQVQTEIATAAPRPGGHIYLSLDTALQKQAEAILGQQRGAIVVMEPDGFVKAMASYPRFQPGDFAAGIDVATWSALVNDENQPMVNRATQGIYPPASIFKIISLAAAIEYLGYSSETPFFCSGTWSGLGEEFVKKCWLETGHGSINLQDGLTQSCDVVFYEIGLALHRADPNWLPQMARAFGLGEPTGIMSLEELPGVIPDNDWKLAARNEPFFDGDAVNMAIGQGDILVTPLQVARFLAAIANGGTLYQPQLVRRISSRDTGDQFFTPQAIKTLPLSSETLSVIQTGLFNVVHGRRGTAREAFDGISYTVAGKTGTAETGQDEPHAWFAGYAPAEAPQVIVVIILENAGEGSKEAAPLFRTMVESYFALPGVLS